MLWKGHLESLYSVEGFAWMLHLLLLSLSWAAAALNRKRNWRRLQSEAWNSTRLMVCCVPNLNEAFAVAIAIAVVGVHDDFNSAAYIAVPSHSVSLLEYLMLLLG